MSELSETLISEGWAQKRPVIQGILNVRLSSIGIAAVFLFLLLENPLETLIPQLSYHDELLFAALVIFAVAKRSASKAPPNRRLGLVLALLLLAVCLGLVGSALSGYQPNSLAIVKDVLAFTKFPIALAFALYLTDDWDCEEAVNLCTKLSSAFIVVCFIFCMINALSPTDMLSHDVRRGVASFRLLYSHPTFLVVALVLAFAMVSRENSRIDAVKIMCLLTLAMTMRDKAFGFIGLIAALWLLRIEKKQKIIPYLVIAAVVVLIVAWPKIELYLSYSNSPREAMYIGAFRLATLHLPLGSGFGTFASSLSGEYYSSAYYLLGISAMQGLNSEDYLDAGDAGIAYYVGQFGIIGIIVIGAIGALLCKELFSRVQPGTPERFAIVSLLGYLAIALVAETALTNASGIASAFALAVIAASAERRAEENGR